jgi:hypothetical protein
MLKKEFDLPLFARYDTLKQITIATQDLQARPLNDVRAETQFMEQRLRIGITWWQGWF